MRGDIERLGRCNPRSARKTIQVRVMRRRLSRMPLSLREMRKKVLATKVQQRNAYAWPALCKSARACCRFQPSKMFDSRSSASPSRPKEYKHLAVRPGYRHTMQHTWNSYWSIDGRRLPSELVPPSRAESPNGTPPRLLASNWSGTGVLLCCGLSLPGTF